MGTGPDRPLEGRTVALLATDGVERAELLEPRRALEEAGARTLLVAPEPGEIRAFDHLDPAEPVPVDLGLDGARPDEIDALVLPGGVANPDRLRTDRRAVAFVRAFADAGKPLAAICHAPWLLIEAGVARGRTLTSFPSIATDLANTGAVWVDREVCVDGPLVTSRRPDDLPAFCAALIEALRPAAAVPRPGRPPTDLRACRSPGAAGARPR